jgi:hypothetical protein
VVRLDDIDLDIERASDEAWPRASAFAVARRLTI